MHLVGDPEEERNGREGAAERPTAIREDWARLFRAEALQEYQRGHADEGHLLEIEQAWLVRAYRVLLGLLAVALLAGVVVWRGLHG